MGNERRGIDPAILRSVERLSLPMRDYGVRLVNVASAAAAIGQIA